MFKSANAKIACVIVAVVWAIVIGGIVVLKWQRHKRDRLRAVALPITIRQAQPIIRAINRYQAERGAPPTSLSALTPKYLRQLPAPGPVSKKGWHYELSPGVGGRASAAGGWALYVRVRDEYSPNIIGGFGDVFVFHPSGKYPDKAYGGMLVPFDDWGYYVE